MRSQPRRPPFVWFVLAVCAVYAGFFAFTSYEVAHHYGVIKAPGWSVGPSSAGYVVSEVDPAGPAAGRIEPGDRLLAIDDDERYGVLGAFNWRLIGGDSTYRVDLDRRGARVSYVLPMPVVPGKQFHPLIGFIGLLFFACGAFLALARPQDPQVRLMGALLMAVGFSTLTETASSARYFLVRWEEVVFTGLVLLSGWAFPIAYHFFSRFPLWKSPGPTWRAIQWLLYALFAVVFWPATLVAMLTTDVVDGATRFLTTHPWIALTATELFARPYFAYWAACLTLALIVTGRNYMRLHEPGSRRRIRWVVVGLMIGLIPYLSLTVAFRVAGWMSEPTYRFWYPIGFLTMVAIPASIVTAVWKEQLFDVRVLVRRGLQYLLARTALRALLVVPIALLAFSIVSHPDRTVAQILTQGTGWLNLVWIGAIATVLPSRQRLQTSLDRRFFREAYHQEQVLAQLIDEIRRHDSLAGIAQLVSARIDSVLHPTTLHVFYRAEDRSERFEAHSSSDLLGPNLSEQRALLDLLGGGTATREFPSEFDDRLPGSERAWLESLGARLIVPITGTRDRLVGVLLLGLRKSDEPYSTTDRRLLQGIAAQIGLVYENQHLQERVRRDADVRRDVLARLDARSVNLLKECPACGVCYDSGTDRCERDGAELALTLPIERTLDGKYRLERALGRGGFGAVFEASDLRLQRLVAAKVMMGSLFGDPTALRRFEREARAAARIDHPALTRVHDYGAVGSGGAYLIMELVAGRTWRAELRRSGVIAPTRASEWFRQLLEGLQVAHAAGIVHRDLKPENVMIVTTKPDEKQRAEADALKIMDFGLAKVLDRGTGVTESVTMVGTAMGTLGYMAPEVLTGEVIDERADIFAVGVMVVEALTGARPFEGPTPEAILTALMRTEYHFTGTSAEIRTLDAVVQRCLAKDARDRYGSAAELARDLVPAVARCKGVAAHPGLTMSDSSTLGERNTW